MGQPGKINTNLISWENRQANSLTAYERLCLMKFLEIASRVTGLSCPIFGVQWNPPEPDRAIGRRVIAFLEDRRILYVPSEAETPPHCVESALRIREFLTAELGRIDSKTPLAQALMAMRAACRKFLTSVEAEDGRIVLYGASHNHYCSWIFISALGELRGVFGVHLATLSSSYGLDIEDKLAKILPESSGGG